jgi:hypothetical protein
VAQIYTSVELKNFKLSRREQLIVLEIGIDRIDTASSFVDYIEENYGFSKSSIWYCLNRLKESGLVEFACKQDHIGKPLSLTKPGKLELGRLGVERNTIVTQFSNSFMERTRHNTISSKYGSSYVRS